jgi:hypothetical protein
MAQSESWIINLPTQFYLKDPTLNEWVNDTRHWLNNFNCPLCHHPCHIRRGLVLCDNCKRGWLLDDIEDLIHEVDAEIAQSSSAGRTDRTFHRRYRTDTLRLHRQDKGQDGREDSTNLSRDIPCPGPNFALRLFQIYSQAHDSPGVRRCQNKRFRDKSPPFFRLTLGWRRTRAAKDHGTCPPLHDEDIPHLAD